MADKAEKDINITYDTLFELLGREKKREDLQPLQESFFSDVLNYLREKEAILKKDNDDNIFSSEDKEKTKTQLDNVKKIIKELYEKRERKIIEIATFKSRTNSSIINTTSLLKEERLLFDALVLDLNKYRQGILMKLLTSQAPVIEEKKPQAEVSNEPSSMSVQAPKPVVLQPSVQPVNSTEPKPNPNQEFNLTVRFVSFVPKFLGKELEVYGPFEPEDVANLPKQIAEILIRKNKAIEVKAN